MPILRAKKDQGRTAAQVRRLYAIAREHGYDREDVTCLLDQYGVESAKDLTREAYDDLCEYVLPGLQPVQPPHVSGRITDPHTGEIYEDEAA